MKIKIIKADPDKWYYKLVGKTRVARTINMGQGYCFILRNYRTILRTVSLSDAVIVEE